MAVGVFSPLPRTLMIPMKCQKRPKMSYNTFRRQVRAPHPPSSQNLLNLAFLPVSLGKYGRRSLNFQIYSLEGFLGVSGAKFSGPSLDRNCAEDARIGVPIEKGEAIAVSRP